MEEESEELEEKERDRRPRREEADEECVRLLRRARFHFSAFCQNSGGQSAEIEQGRDSSQPQHDKQLA